MFVQQLTGSGSLIAMGELTGAAGIGAVSTVEALVSTLRERILAGEIPAGAPLREADLCTQFGVSRHSLRNAMRSLIASGLLVHQANHGVSVVNLSSADVRDIYALRRSLELDAIQELASHPERYDVVRAALERLEHAAVDAPWAEIRDLDLQFHLAIVTSMQRPRTTRVFENLMDELALAFRQLKGELESSAEVAQQHRKIFDAAASGSGQLAFHLLFDHLSSAEQTICAAFEAEASVTGLR
jgi:DNA-binding GntR family transcriptional regulator